MVEQSNVLPDKAKEDVFSPPHFAMMQCAWRGNTSCHRQMRRAGEEGSKNYPSRNKGAVLLLIASFSLIWKGKGNEDCEHIVAIIAIFAL